MKKRLTALLCIFAIFSSLAFCGDSTDSEEDVTPTWVKDLRRGEIITLGSLPFVSIAVSLGYGAYLYNTGVMDSFPNPFSKTSAQFNSDQTKTVFKISLGVSVGIGITDYVINLVKRKNEEKSQYRFEEGTRPEIIPVTSEEIKAILLENSADIPEDEESETSEKGEETVKGDEAEESL